MLNKHLTFIIYLEVQVTAHQHLSVEELSYSKVCVHLDVSALSSVMLLILGSVQEHKDFQFLLAGDCFHYNLFSELMLISGQSCLQISTKVKVLWFYTCNQLSDQCLLNFIVNKYTSELMKWIYTDIAYFQN